MRILLIDDDPMVADVVRRGLSSDGHSVSVATTGEEGLRQARSGEYDLLLVDVVLPGLCGFDIVACRRGEGDRTPILLLSGHGSESNVVYGLELGADGFVTKPFSIEELLARVRAVDRRARMKWDSQGSEEDFLETHLAGLGRKVPECGPWPDGSGEGGV